MKRFQSYKKGIAFGLIAALLLMSLSGCAGAVVGGEVPPVQAEPVAAASDEEPSPQNEDTAANAPVQAQVRKAPADGGKARFVRTAPLQNAPVKAQVINVLEFTGDVTVDSGGVSMPAYSGMRLSAGDKLKTGSNANATLDLNNGGMVMVEKSSELAITQSNAEYIEVSLLAGSIVNSIEKGAGKYAVKANNVTMGVLGTVFRVSLRGGTAKIDLYEGLVALTLTTSTGEETTLTLGAGLSFMGTDDAINNSIESGELETEALDLTELPDDALNWITQQLENRESAADDPAMLEELVNELQEEIERRKNPPAQQPAPVGDTTVVTVPSGPPAPPAPPPYDPSEPRLRWLGGYISGYMAEGDPQLILPWNVDNAAIACMVGLNWSIDDWSGGEYPGLGAPQGSITYSGTDYSFYKLTGGGFSVRSGEGFITHLDASSPPTLDVLLVSEEFDGGSSGKLYDRNTVTLQNKTPEITVDGETVTMTPIEDAAIENYSTPVEPSEEPPEVSPIVIPASSSGTTIPIDEGDAGRLQEGEPLCPNGSPFGEAVAEVTSDVPRAVEITVDVYLPTTVTVEVPLEP